ncbi:hypothetical protein HY745_13910 [Candidatus Desantisbacteria bacterium]|nr:hypothetical protein [Candidatus Desantisbacteria bacterium]
MIDFNEKLKTVLENVDGSIAIVFSGLDGIGVANATLAEKFDTAVLDVELATMVSSFVKVAGNLQLEKVDELVFKAGNIIFFIKMVGNEYFIGIALNSDANLGRARLEVRKVMPSFEKELYA